jgi:hypothetical protein
MPLKRTKELIQWSKEVRGQYDNKCAICGCGGKIDAHHILDKMVFKELRHDPLNGIALCPKHHKFSVEAVHNNPIFFIQWLEENEPTKYEYLLKRQWDIKEQKKKEGILLFSENNKE